MVKFMDVFDRIENMAAKKSSDKWPIYDFLGLSSNVAPWNALVFARLADPWPATSNDHGPSDLVSEYRGCPIRPLRWKLLSRFPMVSMPSVTQLLGESLVKQVPDMSSHALWRCRGSYHEIHAFSDGMGRIFGANFLTMRPCYVCIGWLLRNRSACFPEVFTVVHQSGVPDCDFRLPRRTCGL